MSSKLKILKQKLKAYAIFIRKEKAIYKDCQRGKLEWSEYWNYRHPEKYDYRHMHIAYCLLRGRKYEEIENKVCEGNEPKWSKIEAIMAEYREIEEISCGETVI